MRRLIYLPALLVLALLYGSTSSAIAAVTPPWDPFFAAQSSVADIAAVAPVITSSNRDFSIAAGDACLR